ncbi:hypothetical protein [Albidovulum sp.]|uniref:hypothetical protein n=1 Tax=Albidovulum sp. TaxID=1872424 RepID=UPI0039B89FDC
MTFRARLRRALVRIRQRVPPGLRTLLGLLLVAGGTVGFLPVLGFWMIPLGVLVIGLDVKPAMRRRRAWRGGGGGPGGGAGKGPGR